MIFNLYPLPLTLIILCWSPLDNRFLHFHFHENKRTPCSESRNASKRNAMLIIVDLGPMVNIQAQLKVGFHVAGPWNDMQ